LIATRRSCARSAIVRRAGSETLKQLPFTVLNDGWIEPALNLDQPEVNRGRSADVLEDARSLTGADSVMGHGVTTRSLL